MDIKKTTEELKIYDAEISVTKQRLVAEKMGIQSQLVDVNSKLKETVPMPQYIRLKNQRAELAKMMMAKEQEIASINAARIKVGAVLMTRGKSVEIIKSEIRQLVSIRDKWHGFSMDSSNGQKERQLAWKFSQELKEILACHFANRDDDSQNEVE